ncbi:MAG: helix-turn-helix transcriptional regulator [Bacteroidetes bacterium]|jgi:AraC-like DNA-binding protein|nr:helix-turn-helix transcriptional regulator [Bacteroidota bacterium]MBK6838107.1 helix-turn-helix transcriptional regulator [Bacteroidota bacterium]MBK9525026.1 helix-turn-helix transcriptional regulator [Bacteroidota bacterium]MBK9543829.1 helix-turn-helix transcriptional regulator [Bacteroidota bacterium]MBP6649833.1 helix-turn-helix transcriptional regulator [Bacteroidia bacterium]
MALLSKFIDSLNVHLYRTAFREVVHPVKLNGSFDKHNVIIHLNKGKLLVGPEDEVMPPDSFYFFPAGQPIYVKHANGNYHDLGPDGFKDDDHRSRFLRTISGLEDVSQMKEVFTILAFDVMLYDAIPFFEVLGMPPFALTKDEEFGFLVKHIALENEQNKLGREKLIRNYMEEIMIHMCRYIESQEKFKKYTDKLEFLSDRRLVDIVKHIQENLEKDLSNKTIANIAYVSEDYVGQFFKSLTGKNLQDYIENQRLDRAMFLLRTQPDNIQEIAHRVGFKDPAYFSRRFKMKFGANANSIRQNKNQLV